MSIQILVFSFFGFLGILLSVLFFIKKSNNKTANRLLGVYTFLVSFHMIFKCLYWSGSLETSTFIHLNLVPFLLWVSYGPILFFYLRSILSVNKLVKTDLLFLIPPIILLVLLGPFLFLGTEAKVEVVTNEQVRDFVFFPSYITWVVLALMYFYVFLIYNRFANHRKTGYKEKIWLQWLIGSHIGFISLFLLFMVLIKFEIMDPKYDYFIDAGITFFIGMLAYFGFVQPDVFNGKKPLSKLIPFYKKYSKSGLSESLAKDFKDKLVQLMEHEKPYLKNELRMNELADLLKISRNHTSQIINEHFNLSFFDFINRYRVDEAKALLMNNEEEKLSVTAIAYQVGFNNRASFYKAFKKFTDQSPSTFVNHLKVS